MNRDKFYDDFLLTGSIVDYLIYKGLFEVVHDNLARRTEDEHKAGCDNCKSEEYRK